MPMSPISLRILNLKISFNGIISMNLYSSIKYYSHLRKGHPENELPFISGYSLDIWKSYKVHTIWIVKKGNCMNEYPISVRRTWPIFEDSFVQVFHYTRKCGKVVRVEWKNCEKSIFQKGKEAGFDNQEIYWKILHNVQFFRIYRWID